MNAIVLQGMRRPTLVTQGYEAHAPVTTGPRTIVQVALSAVRIDGRAGTQIEAAHERCRLNLGEAVSMVFHVDFNELPVARPVRVLQGDTYREPYELRLNDAALDLTDATITLAVRRAPGRGAIVARQEITADNDEGGLFTAVVPADDTAKMLGEYWYEIEIGWPAGSAAFGDGCTKTVVAGAFAVYEDALH